MFADYRIVDFDHLLFIPQYFVFITFSLMKDLVNQQLKELQSTQALIKWTRLRESAVKRHRTSNNRACICEILEDSINKTYGPVETKV